MSRYLVYVLSDPTNGEVRYVGKSCSGLTRPKRHYAAAWRPGYPDYQWYVYRWIRSLGKGVRPVIEIVEETAPESLVDAECFWISQFKSWGFKLTNYTNGGEGCLGRPTSAHSRMRASETHRGKIVNDTTRLKMSEARKGRPFVDQNGNTYSTVQEAARRLGISSPTNISSVLHGQRGSAGGYVFKYLK